ncbi:helix-hairpin-helix domain-containing protein [Salinactinospora qingdaonensis]|uniref:Helix-hairpin-helix domain-containing protein n=1 Tax=Salinactinospora qingdaonensis TaxID=702744 RepID=A0ABP7F0K4_9ACTN
MPEVSPHPSPAPAAESGSAAVTQASAALARMGAPEHLARALVAALGSTAAEQITENPWLLLKLSTVTVEQADYCARQLLGAQASPDDARRGRALVERAIRQEVRAGHTAVEERQLERALRSQGVRDPKTALAASQEAEEIVAFETLDGDEDEFAEGEAADLPEPEVVLAPAELGAAEQRLGEGLARLAATSEPIVDAATAAEIVQARAEHLGRHVAAATAAAVVTVALRGVCVLEHGAGCDAAIIDTLACCAGIAHESELGATVACPTASAAAALRARLAAAGAGGGIDVVSLAELLGSPGTGAPETPGAGSPAPAAGLVIVTDAMALDVLRATELVDTCGDGTHLVLLADPCQAPSVGPGQVVSDVITSRAVAVARLPEDAAPGPVARLASTVAAGELAAVDAPGREVVTVPAQSAAEAAHRALQLITDSIPRALEIPAHDVQLITATNGGEAGAQALNTACKTHLNPGPGAHGGFDAGDRVLLTRRGPGHAAGEVGWLREITEAGGVVELRDGTRVTVADPGGLRHGWAVTVAAAHGGSWPAVVAVFPPETKGSRPQVYTALTRPQRHLSLIDATGGELARAVGEVATIPRRTRLVDALRTA